MPGERISIAVSSDRMEARVRIAAGQTAGRAELEAALAAKKVTYGLDPAVVDTLAAKLADGTFAVHELVIAHGTPASDGADSRLELLVPLAQLPGRPQADGSVDYHQRELLHAVQANARVAKLHPATRGRDGKTVDGLPIAAKPGRPCPIRLGKGLEVRADGAVLARRAGVVTVVANISIDVTDCYRHDGDVTVQSGNLDAEGSVIVKGDVQPDFVIRASADVTVQGSVFSGFVEADGNVTVTGAVSGKPQGGVTAGGEVCCHHAISAKLVSGGTLHVLDSAFHCTIEAQALDLQRGHGTLVGGTTRAQQISAKVIGSEASIPTVLVLADAGQQRRETILALVDQHRRTRPVVRRDPPVSGGKLGRAAAAAAAEATQARLQLRRQEKALLASALVEALVAVHPGTVLHFAHKELRIQRPLGPSRFRHDAVTDSILVEAITT